MVGAVLKARPSFFQNGQWFIGPVRREHERLGAVPGLGLDQHVRAAAGAPHGQVEPPVLLAEHQRVLAGPGAQHVPPDLVRPVLGVGDDVEQRTRVGRPGQPVVGALDPLRQVGSAGQVADAQLVELVPVEVDGVGQQPPVRADLPDAEPEIAAAGRVQQQVLVQQHLAVPAELLVLQARHGPGEVGVARPAPAHRLLGRDHPRRQFARQAGPQPARRFQPAVVVGAFGGQVLPHRGPVPVPHPGVRVGPVGGRGHGRARIGDAGHSRC